MSARVRYTLVGLAAVLGIAVAVIVFFASRLDPKIRDYAERFLSEKLQSEVEIGAVHISLLPAISVTIDNVRLLHHGRTDVPPFLIFRQARVTANYASLLARPRSVDQVVLSGLTIHIPPKQPGKPRFSSGKEGKKKSDRPLPELTIGRVIADGTILRILPKDPRRDPLEWDISKLTLKSAGAKQPMQFDAVLKNAKPPGDIVSKGRFGPWNAEDLGLTPVSGTYTFDNADLSVFRGIAGILSSKGEYHGVLGRLETSGTTDTPDFRLGLKGNRVPLKTEFHAIVDGTSGDTFLQPVNAMLNVTPIICSGGVAGTPGVKGKTIDLDTSIPKGRLDDVLRLAVPGGNAPLSGTLKMRAKLLIPPGDVDVVRKLNLKGTFSLDGVRFTSASLQEKIASMSQRAQGRPGQKPEAPVTSHFDGNFTAAQGTIQMDRLFFALPGAQVQLAGSYGMRSEAMDFAGHLRMEARISETVTGVKRWLLKPVDPFFAKDGAGAVIPIKISGTKDKPQFGLNLRSRKKT